MRNIILLQLQRYRAQTPKGPYNGLALSSRTERDIEGDSSYITLVVGSVVQHHRGDLLEGDSSLAHSR